MGRVFLNSSHIFFHFAYDNFTLSPCNAIVSFPMFYAKILLLEGLCHSLQEYTEMSFSGISHPDSDNMVSKEERPQSLFMVGCGL